MAAGAHVVRLDDGVEVVVEREHLEGLDRALDTRARLVAQRHHRVHALHLLIDGAPTARALGAKRVHGEELAALLADLLLTGLDGRNDILGRAKRRERADGEGLQHCGRRYNLWGYQRTLRPKFINLD